MLENATSCPWSDTLLKLDHVAGYRGSARVERSSEYATTCLLRLLRPTVVEIYFLIGPVILLKMIVLQCSLLSDLSQDQPHGHYSMYL